MDAFQDSVRTCLRKYTDFSGRATRPEFWWFFLFQLVVYVIAGSINDLLYWAAFLGLLLPSLAVGARRMHDIGKSGWILLLGLIPLVGLVLLYFAAQPGSPAANRYGQPVPGAAAIQ